MHNEVFSWCTFDEQSKKKMRTSEGKKEWLICNLQIVIFATEKPLVDQLCRIPQGFDRPLGTDKDNN